MSLRARLSLALVVLAALGLTLAGVVTYRTLRVYMYDRFDEQLEIQASALVRPRRATEPPPVAYGSYAELRGPAGRTVQFFATGAPLPDLDGVDTSRRFWTVGATEGPTRFRVITRALSNGSMLLFAEPLDDIERTLDRLLAIELVVSGAVLATLAIVGWVVVRRELRPLASMAETADGIAAGDLSRRVEHVDERTEVGRLGAALNTMLQQIETAFAGKEASETRLRQFVADASHELRTPLTSIRGYSELFRRGADQNPDDLAKVMRRIEDEAGRMGILVDDLLLLARLDQGRPLERRPVDLTAVASDAVDDARVVATEHVITFSPNGTVTVTGDDARLRQVVGNLLANARTHTPAGTNVEVRIRAEDSDAVIEVADDGPGMTAEDAARAFERFWRGDPSRTRDRGGTGLGLSIVAAIAAAHGGRAEVESAPGAGATFRVRLPLGTAEAATPPMGEPPDAAAV